MLLEVAFWLSVACTVAGSAFGDRASLALMFSALFIGTMTALGADFALWVWALVDFVTALAIIRRDMPRRDMLIVACFVPGWAFYLIPDPWRFYGTSCVVIAQMALTIPLAQLRAHTGRIPPMPDIIGDIFKKVAP